MRALIFFLVFVCVVLVLGCSPGVSFVSKYGPAYNDVREKNGVAIIPRTWVIADMGYFFDCYDPNPPQAKPHRLYKRVAIGRDGKILAETDDYYSGKSFFWGPDREKFDQRISITYYYNRVGNPWFVVKNLGPDEYNKTITIHEARDLLRSWGLKD